MKKLNLKNIDFTLVFLIALSIINIFGVITGTSIIRYVTLIGFLFITLIVKEEKIIPVLLFLHPNSGLYDDIGFKYLFNIVLLIIAMKYLLFFRYKMPKRSILTFAVIAMMEVILCLISGYASISGMLPLVSWISSYIILIVVSNNLKKINFATIYKYFFLGFVMAFICGWIYPILQWGLDIPTAYRFIGLLRDPNYYCCDALLLIFSASTYANITKKSKYLYLLGAIIMGICSVSKTFILILMVGFIFKRITNIKRMNLKSDLAIIFVSVIALYIGFQQGLIDLFINKYLYRAETTSLLTGRDYLWSFYFQSIFNSPKNLFIGNSLTYYADILNPGINNSFFDSFIAHNTYLDVVVSWGVIGVVLYLFFIKSIFKNCDFQVKEYVKNCDFISIVFVLLLSLMVLSYLGVDAFAIIILYIVIFKYSLSTIKE